jgi:hypothetical protein
MVSAEAGSRVCGCHLVMAVRGELAAAVSGRSPGRYAAHQPPASSVRPGSKRRRLPAPEDGWPRPAVSVARREHAAAEAGWSVGVARSSIWLCVAGVCR